MSVSIDIQNNYMTALDQLKTIDSMARSSSKTIGGNIGMIDGHVVKFNTHWQERLFSKTTDEMRDASDTLRNTLQNIVKTLLAGNDAKISQINSMIAGKGLLQRSVVAKVVDQVAEAKLQMPSKQMGWGFYETDFKSSADEIRANRTTGQKTDIATVRAHVNESVAEWKVQCQKFVDDAMPLLRASVDKMKQFVDPYGKISLGDEDQLKKLMTPSLVHLFKQGFADKIGRLAPGGANEYTIDAQAMYVLKCLERGEASSL